MVCGGVVIENQEDNILANPIIVEKSVGGEKEDKGKATTGLGIEDVAVDGGVS